MPRPEDKGPAPGQARATDRGKSTARGGFQSLTIPTGTQEVRVPVPEGQEIAVPRGKVEPKKSYRISVMDEGAEAVIRLDRPAEQDVTVHYKVTAEEPEEPDEPPAQPQ